ncbi:MAG: 4Fe-4S dicluster domain-containing protein [Verrucomicrobiales bacterium]|nr:4Fe-4S dicluster domain-containing protein [Verrucomicrobiales bacterium]
MSEVDVLIVGAGPAGLASAIRLRRRLAEARKEASVVVIDKAPRLGYHNLSGAVFEADCLDELCPGWRADPDPFVKNMVPVERDELVYLTRSKMQPIPASLVPRHLRHQGDHAISINRLVKWLGGVAQQAGAEVQLGFAAGEVLQEGGGVRGVRLVDLGRNTRGRKQANFLAGERIEARVTILADGSRGVLSRQVTERHGGNRNSQVYSVGIKQLIKLPSQADFGAGRVIHTIGYPCRRDVFGGGFLYDMGKGEVAVGLILGLDWRYTDLNPQREMELFKAHPFVAGLLEGGEVVATGVKTVPEGGYYALPKLAVDGALLAGDAAGFVNMRKIKGIHYAIRSGIAAADTVFDALARNDFSESSLKGYRQALEPGVLRPMRSARNYRQCFKLGLYLGAPLSTIQHLLPFGLDAEPDHRSTRKRSRLNRSPDGGLDKATFVSLSGAAHREDEPSHIIIRDPAVCLECKDEYGNPCVQLCPGEVYRLREGELVLSPSNCMHDGSCAVKCPYQNIDWTPPEGGEGPRYRKM